MSRFLSLILITYIFVSLLANAQTNEERIIKMISYVKGDLWPKAQESQRKIKELEKTKERLESMTSNPQPAIKSLDKEFDEKRKLFLDFVREITDNNLTENDVFFIQEKLSFLYLFFIDLGYKRAAKGISATTIEKANKKIDSIKKKLEV